MADKIVVLGRDQILNADDITRELVEVPEWGGAVWIKSMTGRERDAFEESLVVRKGAKITNSLQQFRAKLVAMTAVDDEGKRLFTAADVEALGRKNAAALSRCSEVATRLSSISREDAEEMIKNSEADQGESSGLI